MMSPPLTEISFKVAIMFAPDDDAAIYGQLNTSFTNYDDEDEDDILLFGSSSSFARDCMPPPPPPPLPFPMPSSASLSSSTSSDQSFWNAEFQQLADGDVPPCAPPRWSSRFDCRCPDVSSPKRPSRKTAVTVKNYSRDETDSNSNVAVQPQQKHSSSASSSTSSSTIATASLHIEDVGCDAPPALPKRRQRSGSTYCSPDTATTAKTAGTTSTVATVATRHRKTHDDKRRRSSNNNKNNKSNANSIPLESRHGGSAFATPADIVPPKSPFWATEARAGNFSDLRKTQMVVMDALDILEN